MKKVVREPDLSLQQHFLINLVFYARDLAIFYTVKSLVKALGLYNFKMGFGWSETPEK